MSQSKVRFLGVARRVVVPAMAALLAAGSVPALAQDAKAPAAKAAEGKPAEAGKAAGAKETKDAKKGAAAAAPKETKKADKKMNENTVAVTMKTSQGTIKLELDKEKAPKTVEQIVRLAKDGYYTGKIFHRVIDGFMVQGGGLDAKLVEHRTWKNAEITKLPLEATNGLKNLRGTLAMARTNDPNSASSQFFVNLVDNKFLDNGPSNPGYTVFGKVTEGMDVVDKIAKVKTGNFGMYSDVPAQAVTIEAMTVE